VESILEGASKEVRKVSHIHYMVMDLFKMDRIFADPFFSRFST
jgi:hypothetical protein